ncbi:uncharacterized protein [Bemisia tabaci]|uniref:uncharacterized protein n=1 Tax=Bemisia tabaci TaxID=7038 RepID=UPI003B27FFEB
MALNDTEIDLLLDNSEDEDDPPGPLCDSDLESDYSPDDSEDSDASTDSNSDDENETASQITNAANGRDGPPPNNAPAPAQNVARGRGRGRFYFYLVNTFPALVMLS